MAEYDWSDVFWLFSNCCSGSGSGLLAKCTGPLVGECENEDNSPRPSCPCTVFANCFHQIINSLGLQSWLSSEQPLFLDLGLGARLRPGCQMEYLVRTKVCVVWCATSYNPPTPVRLLHLIMQRNLRPNSNPISTRFSMIWVFGVQLLFKPMFWSPKHSSALALFCSRLCHLSMFAWQPCFTRESS